MKNELIEKYVYAVVKRLPEKERDEVEKELNSNIEDMLKEDYSDENIETIINSLGSPKELAKEYLKSEKCLISPAVYHDYISTLKIVLIAVIPLALLFSAINGMVNIIKSNSIDNIINGFTSPVIDMILSMIGAGLIIVTLIYILIDRDKIKLSKKPWSTSDLKKIPKHYGQSIGIPKLIGYSVSIFICLVLIVLFAFVDFNSIALTEPGFQAIPLFDTSYLEGLKWLLISSASIIAISRIIALIYRKDNLLTLIMNLSTLVIGFIGFSVVLLGNLWNNDFLVRVATEVGRDINLVEKIVNMGQIMIVIALGIIAAVKITIAIIKFKKRNMTK